MNDILQHHLDRFRFYGYKKSEKVTKKTLLESAWREISIYGRNAELKLFAKGKRGSNRKRKSLFPNGAVGTIQHERYAEDGYITITFNCIEVIKSFDCLDGVELYSRLRRYYDIHADIPYELPVDNRGLYLTCIGGVGFDGAVISKCDEILQKYDRRSLIAFLARLDVFLYKNKIKKLKLKTFEDFLTKDLNEILIGIIMK